jgi:glycosyltransferase involved in cell wall biosynthesis
MNTVEEPPLRILLGAFACAPGLGSEEGVGWGLTRALAQHHRVHVLTTRRYRAVIERHLAVHPCPLLTFSYLDFHPLLLRGLVHTAMWQLYYHAWQLRIAAWARDIARDFAPDVVHHATYGRYWTPTSLWRLGRPFIWGPLGGGDQCPPAFIPCLSRRDRLVARLRSLAQELAHRDPLLRQTARRCDLALASTPATGARLRALGCRQVGQLLQNAVDETLIAIAPAAVAPGPEKIFCTVGRLLGWKCQALALRAFAEAALPGSRLVIIGIGPTERTLRRLARELGVERDVHFTGALPRGEMLAWMRRSVALLHVGLHDQSPTVVFEAMAQGTPTIALALAGLPLQITPETGFLVPAKNPAQACADMAAAMRRLAANPGLRRRLGEAAIRRVATDFTWTRKAEQMVALFRQTLRATPVYEAASASILPAPALGAGVRSLH